MLARPGTPRARRGPSRRSRTRCGSSIATTRAARSCPRPSNGLARSASATWRARPCTRPGRCGSGRGEFGEALDLHGQALSTARGARTWRARRSRTTACARRTSSSGRSRTVSNTACWPTRSSASSASDRWWRTTATCSRGCSASSAGARRRWRRRTPRSRRRTRSATSGRRGSGCTTGRSSYLSAGRLDAALADGVRGTVMLRDLGVVRGVIIGDNIQNSVRRGGVGVRAHARARLGRARTLRCARRDVHAGADPGVPRVDPAGRGEGRRGGAASDLRRATWPTCSCTEPG